MHGHADSPGLARLIEKQMRNWELSRSQRLEHGGSSKEQVAHFITIANICGAGGNEIARRLSETLGWSLFDREILSTMAGDDEVRTRLYRSMDERDLGWFESTFRGMMQEELRKNDYFHRLTETVLCLARQGPAVLVGRAADLILPRDRGLRVKVIASMERCAENFARRSNTTIEQARAMIDRIEKERRDFIANHFRIDAYEPTRFDVLVNVERLDTDQAVELILTALRLKCRVRVPAPV
jgi:cytidylate kinase